LLREGDGRRDAAEERQKVRGENNQGRLTPPLFL
jgi:hypothetical protein